MDADTTTVDQDTLPKDVVRVLMPKRLHESIFANEPIWKGDDLVRYRELNAPSAAPASIGVGDWMQVEPGWLNRFVLFASPAGDDLYTMVFDEGVVSSQVVTLRPESVFVADEDVPVAARAAVYEACRGEECFDCHGDGWMLCDEADDHEALCKDCGWRCTDCGGVGYRKPKTEA